MGTAIRQGSDTVYYLDAAQLKNQPAVGGIKCVPVQSTPGRPKKTVYRMAPSSSLQADRVLQPVVGTTIAGGLQCDSCPPLYRQNVSPEDCRYGGGAAASANEPQVVRVLPRGKNIYVEEVKPSSQQRKSSRSARQKLPNVMQIVEDRNWYDKLAAMVEDTESEVDAEPETCRECIEELIRRRRAPDPEPAVVASPVYVAKVPKSKRSCSRRFASSSPLPQRSLSRGPSPSSSPRCTNCTPYQPSYGTARSVSKPNTSRSRSRKWYE